ncbi:aldehyde dehydrogenase family protein [Streptomyces sp. BI20]|uniref:aldehyde dehydrogenase family protein n=1 Tax=Streptomyces sp. BI20 TaxID=3403460 RepID=UPI003C70D221
MASSPRTEPVPPFGEHRDLYLDGRWRPALGTDAIEVVNPADESVLGSVPAGSAEDVDAAVAAARAALPAWSATPPARRAEYLTALRDRLVARTEEFAAVITAELGSPTVFSQRVHVGAAVAVSGSFADLAASHPFEERLGNSTVLHVPVGVVGAITPWNYPLHQVVAKVAPALAAGCTIVLKPAENTPFTARLLADLLDGIGLPAGVFNLVTGRGPEAGRALVEHPGVDLVSFTGSSAVGSAIGAAAGAAVKRVALELGGKSANVILPGADLAKAVRAGVQHVMNNAGQSCNAQSRMLVHVDDLDEAVALAAEAARAVTVGDPTDPAHRMGPVISARQRDRVRGYIESGVKEGARLVAGGPEAPLPRGHWVAPTVFAGVTPDMTIAREEIFGPVLSILSYTDEEEALRLANDSEYGLGGAVWAADAETATAFARRLETGQVDVNGGRFNPIAPFGGFKKSGVGRELGPHGLSEYLQTRSLQY